MINISDIAEGDVVTVSDGYNRARGTLNFDNRLNLVIDALGTMIVVLKRSPGNRLTLKSPLKIEDHQPALIPRRG